MNELLALVEARRRAPEATFAVATVLGVDGSSYRRAGARMLVNSAGRVAGSVSGGCLEESVILAAQAALLDGYGRFLTFDTTRDGDVIFGSGLGCQGKIRIGIEVLLAGERWVAGDLAETVRISREPAVLVTRAVEAGGPVEFEHVVFRSEPELSATPWRTPWHAVIAGVFRTGKNLTIDEAHPALAEWIAPPFALLIFGHGPDVTPLVEQAVALGHEVTVVDRRAGLSSSPPFPMAHRSLTLAARDVARALRPDSRTAAVLMNHHYETDRDLLAVLLRLDLSYVAALGPQRRTERMLRELNEAGHRFSAKELASLHGPAGLDIGADHPDEIALSILAEMQAVMSGRNGGQLKFRPAPIHGESGVAEPATCASRA